MRGRYVGPVETTFDAPVGTVLYGDEFAIPAGRERSFLQHGYVEPADKAAKELYAKMTHEDCAPGSTLVDTPKPDSSAK